ncbi:MAG: putative manganese-dependent inorganic diphosphatase [Akkermansiaceae bacterium]|nr:putative manganese-dependent inorganic diphosphatase [Akkermansiaceae bacterium]MCF7730743.1 putative manganese-dependent inorganic diphosphatase [Akkermansiaceae bacterium]
MTRSIPVTRPTFVVGHQRPDTDSAVSAVVYADLLNSLSRDETFEGIVLGEVSTQTKWLFAEAGTALPRQVSHLHTCVRDVARRDVLAIGQEAALGEALNLIIRHRIGVVPVLDANRKLLGLLSDRMPTANYFYHANAEDFLGVLFSVADLERYLKLTRWQKPQAEATGQIVLDRSLLAPGSLVLIGDQPELLAHCRDAGAAVVVTCGSAKNTAWRKAMRACPDLGVLHYRGSLMALVTQLPMAIPAARLMQTEGFPKLTPDQTLHEVQSLLRRAQFALPVMNPDGTLFGVLSRSEVMSFPRGRVVLVDHFEQHQAPEGIEDSDIVEIVDHHRVGTLETALPIRVDCRPVGSTATIIACKFAENGRRPTPAQAMLLLGAIVADTLLLTSPTATEVDCQQAAALARLAKVGLQKFGREVLVRNDETLDRPSQELVEKDLKEFSGGGVRFAVAQIETVDRSQLDDARLKDLATALHERRLRGGWEFAALLVTDIFRGDSLVLIDVETSLLAHKLGPSGEVWAGCVSRKKQFLPELLKRLEEPT